MIYIDSDYCSEPIILRSIAAIEEEMKEIDLLLFTVTVKLAELDSTREEMEAILNVMGDGKGCDALDAIVQHAENTTREAQALCERLEELRDELDETLWYMRGGAYEG